MKTINLKEASNINFSNASVALGTFDGLHKGHMALIEAAKKHEGDTIAFTFDALPIDIFKKSHKPMQLYTMQEKKQAFSKTGIDYLCVTHFDEVFAGIDKVDFEQMLKDVFSPDNVIAGYNYTYGKLAQGTVKELEQDSEKFGYNVEIIPKIIVEGIPVSSTIIRNLIWGGNIDTANKLLGYEYSISGAVKHGNKIGKSLGFPTANISVPREKIVPKNGVYSISAYVKGKKFRSICNIGVNPTVTSAALRSVEAHIIGYEGNLYDETIKISFKKRIRDEIRFENKQQLIEQIKKDIIQAKEQ